MQKNTAIADSAQKLRKELAEFRPDTWEQLGQISYIGLSKDQVISYMQHQHIGLGISEEEALTPAMINNYIKSGLLPRANGKRYTREHIALLTAICLLKQVLSVSDAGALLAESADPEDTGLFYEKFRDLIDREYKAKASRLEEIGTEEDAARLAMELAVSSYAEQLVCRQLIRMMAEQSEEN